MPWGCTETGGDLDVVPAATLFGVLYEVNLAVLFALAIVLEVLTIVIVIYKIKEPDVVETS